MFMYIYIYTYPRTCMQTCIYIPPTTGTQCSRDNGPPNLRDKGKAAANLLTANILPTVEIECVQLNMFVHIHVYIYAYIYAYIYLYTYI
jgi:hypothetical protein